MTTDEIKQAAEAWLFERWHSHMDNRLQQALNRTRIVIETLQAIGVLTDKGAELWWLRVKWSCPGHDAGRKWCAYCGEVTTSDG